jgi:hypothetical protein
MLGCAMNAKGDPLAETVRFYETLGLECTSRTKISEDVTEPVIENPERGA